MAFTLRREPSPNQNTKFSFLRLPIDLKSVVSERLPQQLTQPVEATRQLFRHCCKQGYGCRYIVLLPPYNEEVYHVVSPSSSGSGHRSRTLHMYCVFQ